MSLSNEEAKKIANIIASQFEEVAADYDFSKYPTEDYENFKKEFSLLNVENNQIENALVWKWGHWGKRNYPGKQKNLIHEIKEHWVNFANSDSVQDSEKTYNWWRKTFNRSTTYITAAYITHLVHHHEPLPIIDQHNYRAMNTLKSDIREKYLYKKKPSNWTDITMLKQFMLTVLTHLPNLTFGELDRFLMMYGRNYASR